MATGHCDLTPSCPPLQVKARWAIASAKDGRPAYDRVIKIFKALKKEVDAVVGDSK